MRKTHYKTTMAAIAFASMLGGHAASACDNYRVVNRRSVPVRTVQRTVYQPIEQHVVYTNPITRVAETQRQAMPVATVAIAKRVPVAAQEINIVEVDERPLVQAGSTLQSNALFLGNEMGYVFLKFGGVSHRCRIEDWSAERVTFALPSFDIAGEVDAEIEMVRPDGKSVKTFQVKLAGQADLEEVASQATLSVVTPGPLGPQTSLSSL